MKIAAPDRECNRAVAQPYLDVSETGSTFGVSADGKRFVMVRGQRAGAQSSMRWVLVQNWRREFASR